MSSINPDVIDSRLLANYTQDVFICALRYEGMKKEFEVVSHSQLRDLNVLLVHLAERAVHLHRELEIGLILEGEVELQAKNDARRLAAGEIYLVNPMEPHEFVSKDEALILAVQLSPQLGEQFYPEAVNMRFSGESALGCFYAGKPRHYRLLRGLCLELAQAFLSREESYEFKCFALAALLLRQLTVHVPWTVLSTEDSLSARQRAERIFAVTDYVQRNFTRKLLLGEIAEREKLSLSYLSHFFKDTMGVTFQDYLNSTRFEYACGLLEKTDRSILDISVSSGFSDVRYFSNMFRKHFGCSPSSYRSGSHSRSRRIAPISSSSQYIYPAEEALELLSPFREALMKEDGDILLFLR